MQYRIQAPEGVCSLSVHGHAVAMNKNREFFVNDKATASHLLSINGYVLTGQVAPVASEAPPEVEMAADDAEAAGKVARRKVAAADDDTQAPVKVE